MNKDLVRSSKTDTSQKKSNVPLTSFWVPSIDGDINFCSVQSRMTKKFHWNKYIWKEKFSVSMHRNLMSLAHWTKQQMKMWLSRHNAWMGFERLRILKLPLYISHISVSYFNVQFLSFISSQIAIFVTYQFFYRKAMC